MDLESERPGKMQPELKNSHRSFIFEPSALHQNEGFVGVLEDMYPSVGLAMQLTVGEYCVFHSFKLICGGQLTRQAEEVSRQGDCSVLKYFGMAETTLSCSLGLNYKFYLHPQQATMGHLWEIVSLCQ